MMMESVTAPFGPPMVIAATLAKKFFVTAGRRFVSGSLRHRSMTKIQRKRMATRTAVMMAMVRSVPRVPPNRRRR